MVPPHVLGKLDELEDFMFRTPVQRILIALPWADIKLPFLIDRLKAFNCEVPR